MAGSGVPNVPASRAMPFGYTVLSADVSTNSGTVPLGTASLATVSGATIREVQARLGHASPAAAYRYQHVLENRDAEIARRLDGFLRGGDEAFAAPAPPAPVAPGVPRRRRRG